VRLFALEDGAALALAEARGTPCFAYRLDVAQDSFASLRAALPPRVRLAYAVKANPHPGLLELFARLGASFDCASGGELERVGAAGVPGSRILFAGPGKAGDELALALRMGARIQADGIEDFERVAALAAGRPAHASITAIGLRAPIALSLRVHPASGIAEGSRIIGGTGPSAFGVDEEDLDGFLREARRFPDIRVSGLQVFAASNELDARRLLANHAAALAIGERMEGVHGLSLELVDLGGGLGIPYAEGEAELDIGALGRGLAGLLDDNPWFRGGLLLEPGRWLAGPCGVYLARVLRVKESRGTRFAVLEGGVNHLLRPLLTGQEFPARAPGKSGEPLVQTLAGPLCTSLDRLGSPRLPLLEAGDLVMLGQAGAYGFTEAMGAFLSHPPPAEHCV
jgi:diaminopimelate decarboxylase